MNVTALKDHPSYQQVKIKVKTQIPTHEYVIPSNFATIPNNRVQSRIMKNAHNKKRFSLPPSIKEEENDEENDEDNIPLAILAYRKGFITPNKEQDVFPLVSLQKRKSNPITTYNNFHQFYQFSNHSSSSNSSQSSTEMVLKNQQQNGTESKFYRRYSSK